MTEVVDRRPIAERVSRARTRVLVVADTVLHEVVRHVDAAADGELVADRLIEIQSAIRAPRAGVDLNAVVLSVVERTIIAGVADAA